MVEAQPQREWEPTQVVMKEPVDLRFAALGPRGYKINPVKSRKRGREEVEDAGPVPMDHDEPMASELPKRQRVEGEAYRKVSGKVWKEKGVKAGADKAAIVGTSWEKKMAEKAARQRYLDVKRTAQAAYKDKRKAIAQQKAAAAQRKKENQAKSAVVQKITNAATVKKLLKSKKQRKLLKKADTN